MSSTTELPFWRPPAPTPADLRRFGLLFCVLFGALAGFLAWRRGLPAATVPAAISASLLMLSLTAPAVLQPAWWPWMIAAKVLGFINSHVLLAIVFYLLFTPIGLFMRLLGRDPLGDRKFHRARKTASAGGSLWIRRADTQLPQHHYERQF